MSAQFTGTITRPGMRVPVGKGHFALVDAADYDMVASIRWYLMRGHNGKLYAYSPRRRRPTLYMHRIIAGTRPGLVTDHVNGDGLDNRRANLRPATRVQNQGNAGKTRRPDGSPHTSQYKGVTWDKSRGRWKASITIQRRPRGLGRYDDEAEAARAYDAAAVVHFGEFARLNFPPEAAA